MIKAKMACFYVLANVPSEKVGVGVLLTKGAKEKKRRKENSIGSEQEEILNLVGAPARALSWHSASLLTRGGDQMGVR